MPIISTGEYESSVFDISGRVDTATDPPLIPLAGPFPPATNAARRLRGTEKGLRGTASGLSLRGADLAGEEIGALVSVGAVGEMRREHGSREDAIADGITGVRGADDLDLVGGEVGNPTVIGAELGVAKSNDTGNLGLLGGGEVLNGAVVHSGSLAIQFG